MNFKKWVKSIQTTGYNGVRMVVKLTFKIDYFIGSFNFLVGLNLTNFQ